MKNKKGVDVYQIAIVPNNRIMASFLFKIMLYRSMPRLTTTVTGALTLLSLFGLIYYFRPIFGGIYWIVSSSCASPRRSPPRSR
jgi:hypothetical protein